MSSGRRSNACQPSLLVERSVGHAKCAARSVGLRAGLLGLELSSSMSSFSADRGRVRVARWIPAIAQVGSGMTASDCRAMMTFACRIRHAQNLSASPSRAYPHTHVRKRSTIQLPRSFGLSSSRASRCRPRHRHCAHSVPRTALRQVAASTPRSRRVRSFTSVHARHRAGNCVSGRTATYPYCDTNIYRPSMSFYRRACGASKARIRKRPEAVACRGAPGGAPPGASIAPRAVVATFWTLARRRPTTARDRLLANYRVARHLRFPARLCMQPHAAHRPARRAPPLFPWPTASRPRPRGVHGRRLVGHEHCCTSHGE